MSSKKKKLTRKMKLELSKLGICWKCGKKTLIVDKNITKCTNGCFKVHKI